MVFTLSPNTPSEASSQDSYHSNLEFSEDNNLLMFTQPNQTSTVTGFSDLNYFGEDNHLLMATQLNQTSITFSDLDFGEDNNLLMLTQPNQTSEFMNIEQSHPDWLEHLSTLKSASVYKKRIGDFFS